MGAKLNFGDRSTHGFALLTTLATILLLATLVLTLQTRSQANLRVLGRLTADLQDRAAKDSLHDRLRGLVADSMAAAANPGARAEGRPGLDGTPFALREGGKDWVVRVQDAGRALVSLDSRAMVNAPSVFRA